jgi:hypothetical protein
MSRSGYSEDYDDQWSLIRWRGAVASAIKGRKGQAFLREMLVAFDGMERKCLIQNELEQEGEVCSIGAVGKARGVNMREIDPEDLETIADRFGIAPALAAEIMWLNDEWYSRETPEDRFTRMHAWITGQIADKNT